MRLLFLSAFPVLLFTASLAHEQKAALTDILYNERTGNLEIAHRFSLHDAEHTLHKATGLKDDLARSSEAQAAFAEYVADRFELRLTDKTVLPLTSVGQELEGGYLWVYQETRIPKPVGVSFFIENTILHDAVKRQVNTVNVRYRSQVTTFVFEESTGKILYNGPADSGKKQG